MTGTSHEHAVLAVSYCLTWRFSFCDVNTRLIVLHVNT